MRFVQDSMDVELGQIESVTPLKEEENNFKVYDQNEEDIELSQPETHNTTDLDQKKEHSLSTKKKTKLKNIPSLKRKLNYDNIIIPSGLEVSFIPEVKAVDSEKYRIVKNINVTIFSAVLCAAVLIYFCIIPILMIYFGAAYFNECPAQKNLPIFLIVGGITTIIKTIIDILFRFKKGFEKERKRFTVPFIILQIFLFAWFVIGCIWIYQMFQPVYDDKFHPEYCNRTLYLFSFWTINSIFIVVCVYICFICLFTSILLMCLYIIERCCR